MKNNHVSELLFSILLRTKDVIVYGATDEASYVITHYGDYVTGVADEKLKPNTSWGGKPCRALSSIKRDTVVVNCVTCARALEAEETLRENADVVVNVYDFIGLLLPNEQFTVSASPVLRDWRNFPLVFKENAAVFHSLRTLLADETSREHFSDYLEGRLTGDISRLARGKTFQNPATMYFQPFLPNLDGYVFLDIGCFDGSNTEAFLDKSADSSAVCFEPNPLNVSAIESRLKSQLSRCTLLNCALGERATQVHVALAGSGSVVSNTGAANSVVVAQKTLDEVFEEQALWGKNVLVKMDVEGSEANILQGATRVLRESNTLFALSCYHKSRDLVDFFQAFQAVLGSRKLYFRHLTSGACESVLFVV